MLYTQFAHNLNKNLKKKKKIETRLIMLSLRTILVAACHHSMLSQ